MVEGLLLRRMEKVHRICVHVLYYAAGAVVFYLKDHLAFRFLSDVIDSLKINLMIYIVGGNGGILTSELLLVIKGFLVCRD